MAVTDLLTPDEVREMLVMIDVEALWPYEKVPHLCKSYLTLWKRCERLEADVAKLSRREVDDD